MIFSRTRASSLGIHCSFSHIPGRSLEWRSSCFSGAGNYRTFFFSLPGQLCSPVFPLHHNLKTYTREEMASQIQVMRAFGEHVVLCCCHLKRRDVKQDFTESLGRFQLYCCFQPLPLDLASTHRIILFTTIPSYAEITLFTFTGESWQPSNRPGFENQFCYLSSK